MDDKCSNIKSFEKRISKKFIDLIDLYDFTISKNNFKEKEGKLI